MYEYCVLRVILPLEPAKVWIPHWGFSQDLATDLEIDNRACSSASDYSPAQLADEPIQCFFKFDRYFLLRSAAFFHLSNLSKMGYAYSSISSRVIPVPCISSQSLRCSLRVRPTTFGRLA